MKTAQLFFGLFLGLIITALSSNQAYAAQAKGFSISLDDTRPSTSSNYTFTWTTASTATLQEVEFYFCTTPSGSCNKPAATVTTTALKGTISGYTGAQWSLNAASSGVPRLRHVGTGESVSSNTVVSVQMTTITNHAIDDCQAGGDQSSDTCYIRMYTFNDATAPITSAVDEAVGSYTVVEEVTVTARVDPLFTFVVSGTSASQVYNQITTSVASSYSTLPFSNLTANIPKYAAHALTVTTNTQSGYTISAQMRSQMTGVYAGNNIDPFISTWSAPTTWTEPTGTTPNVDTGWIGMNTTDTDVPNWSSGAQLFGPISGTSRIVMLNNSSDPGTAPVYVTYGIEANVFQPADTYTGYLIYLALPKY